MSVLAKMRTWKFSTYFQTPAPAHPQLRAPLVRVTQARQLATIAKRTSHRRVTTHSRSEFEMLASYLTPSSAPDLTPPPRPTLPTPFRSTSGHSSMGNTAPPNTRTRTSRRDFAVAAAAPVVTTTATAPRTPTAGKTGGVGEVGESSGVAVRVGLSGPLSPATTLPLSTPLLLVVAIGFVVVASPNPSLRPPQCPPPRANTSPGTRVGTAPGRQQLRPR